MARYYTLWGPVSGGCGHLHADLAGVAECVRATAAAGDAEADRDVQVVESDPALISLPFPLPPVSPAVRRVAQAMAARSGHTRVMEEVELGTEDFALLDEDATQIDHGPDVCISAEELAGLGDLEIRGELSDRLELPRRNGIELVADSERITDADILCPL